MFKYTSRSPLAEFLLTHNLLFTADEQTGWYWCGGKGQINVEGTCAESINVPLRVISMWHHYSAAAIEFSFQMSL